MFSLVANDLLGCSYLEKAFPDKERDYQYTTEIPTLNWPAELRKNQQSDNAAATTTANTTGTEVSASSENTSDKSSLVDPAAANATQVEARNSETDDRVIVSSVEIIKYDDGESRLRLGAGFEKAWRVVNKALSRNSIEVTERNHGQGQFSIQYDPDEKQAKDDSFLDELAFIFQGINTNDEKYLLKLDENKQGTDLSVLNEEHLPVLKNDAALRLLKLLADTINADLSKQVDKPSGSIENLK